MQLRAQGSTMRAIPPAFTSRCTAAFIHRTLAQGCHGWLQLRQLGQQILLPDRISLNACRPSRVPSYTTYRDICCGVLRLFNTQIYAVSQLSPPKHRASTLESSSTASPSLFEFPGCEF